jgi:hypothetical protein
MKRAENARKSDEMQRKNQKREEKVPARLPPAVAQGAHTSCRMRAGNAAAAGDGQRCAHQGTASIHAIGEWRAGRYAHTRDARERSADEHRSCRVSRRA